MSKKSYILDCLCLLSFKSAVLILAKVPSGIFGGAWWSIAAMVRSGKLLV
jgi:hypothetical protein